MNNSLKMNVGGIKCDNKKCDFKDMIVLFENYDQWLNKPCPKCGYNLLTEQDLFTIKTLMDLTEIINDCVPAKTDEKLFKMSAEMNGTGEMTFSSITTKEEEE